MAFDRSGVVVVIGNKYLFCSNFKEQPACPCYNPRWSRSLQLSSSAVNAALPPARSVWPWSSLGQEPQFTFGGLGQLGAGFLSLLWVRCDMQEVCATLFKVLVAAPPRASPI